MPIEHPTAIVVELALPGNVEPGALEAQVNPTNP
jgi:hypothetical protein